VTDPPLPAGTVRLTTPPPVYTRWWAMVEACSGITRPLAAVTWYVAPGLTVPDGALDVTGYWSPARNRIVVARSASLVGDPGDQDGNAG